MTRDELYDLLVRACQTLGFTTEATYESLHNAVDSIREDDPEEDPGPTPLAQIEQRIEALITPHPVDELVHDIYAGKAVNVNNGGPGMQADFLLKELGLDEAIKSLDALKVEVPAS